MAFKNPLCFIPSAIMFRLLKLSENWPASGVPVWLCICKRCADESCSQLLLEIAGCLTAAPSLLFFQLLF